MDEDWKVFTIFILIMALILAVAIGLLGLLDRATCNQSTKDIGLPHQWGWFSGCRILENNKWIPLDNWRYLGEK